MHYWELAKEVTEEELETAFGRYGRVLGVDVKRDRATSSSLGYGFVQYSTRREASNCSIEERASGTARSVLAERAAVTRAAT